MRQALSSQLREIILGTALTAYALGKRAEVDPGVIQRFLNGERDIRLETADRIAGAVGVRLVETSKRSRSRDHLALDVETDPRP